jgi:hypothetical protein
MNNDLYLVSAGKTMGENLTAIICQDLIRRKGNCPSGYRYRTRHPQGWVYFAAGLLMRRGEKDLIFLLQKGRRVNLVAC